MKTKDLTKEELQKVTQLYIEERDTMPWNCSLEEFCESFVRKCECCAKLVTVEDSDDELQLNTNSVTGKKYYCCEECSDDWEE